METGSSENSGSKEKAREFARYRHDRGICECRGPIGEVKDRFGRRRPVYERCPAARPERVTLV